MLPYSVSSRMNASITLDLLPAEAPELLLTLGAVTAENDLNASIPGPTFRRIVGRDRVRFAEPFRAQQIGIYTLRLKEGYRFRSTLQR
jgi:hypothetical protein